MPPNLYMYLFLSVATAGFATANLAESISEHYIVFKSNFSQDDIT